MKIKTYLYNILLGIDQLVNTILGGEPDETISSRMGRHLVKKDSWISKIICYWLNKVDKNHCIDAIEEEFRGL